jgi:hypothetical protein
MDFELLRLFPASSEAQLFPPKSSSECIAAGATGCYSMPMPRLHSAVFSGAAAGDVRRP